MAAKMKVPAPAGGDTRSRLGPDKAKAGYNHRASSDQINPNKSK